MALEKNNDEPVELTGNPWDEKGDQRRSYQKP